MLRAPASSSPVADFTTGRFRAVIPDEMIVEAARVLLCSGKIAHELKAERDRRHDTRTAIVRLEQLYPFPRAAIAALLEACPAATEIVWVQEEPRNMGALDFVRKHLQGLLGDRHLASVSRAESASPATGSARAHMLEQQAVIQFALQRTPSAPGD